MQADYRYTLLRGSRKYKCPACSHKRFKPYIDSDNGKQLPDQYGRCDREIECAYHLNPYTDGYARHIDQERNQDPGNWELTSAQVLPIAPVKLLKKPCLMPIDTLRQSQKSFDGNHLVMWLQGLFDAKTVDKLINRYQIGTSKHWDGGATVFWQITPSGDIRGGKIMDFHPDTGKRVKEPVRITWVHRVLDIPDYNLVQCFFGSHLLAGNNKPVALVESEKTALIASVYLPDFIWLAVGGISFLKAENCQFLKGRNVILFPDLNGFEKWSQKAQELTRQMTGTFFAISDLLEQRATEEERAAGLDLADYLTRFDYREFIQPVNLDQRDYLLPGKQPDESEKGENSEALKTNIKLEHKGDDVISGPTNENSFMRLNQEIEYYRHTYPELCEAIGKEEAQVAVMRYQQLSEDYADIKEWPIHNCLLLTSYSLYRG